MWEITAIGPDQEIIGKWNVMAKNMDTAMWEVSSHLDRQEICFWSLEAKKLTALPFPFAHEIKNLTDN